MQFIYFDYYRKPGGGEGEGGGYERRANGFARSVKAFSCKRNV